MATMAAKASGAGAADTQLQHVARLDGSYYPEAFCDGLLLLSKRGTTRTCLSICNPVTGDLAPLWTPWDFDIFTILEMYLHRPTGEYRLLLRRRSHIESIVGTTGCYVFTLRSDQAPRYIGGLDGAATLYMDKPALVQDNLHWYPMHHQGESRLLVAFDTKTESFRHMRAPAGPTKSSVFEMDGKLGIGGYNDAMDVVDIWVLQNYEGEVWVHQWNAKLPMKEIRGRFGLSDDDSYSNIVSVDGDVLLLVSYGGWLFYVNTDGKLVDTFHRDGQKIYASDLRLKQTLVSHITSSRH